MNFNLPLIAPSILAADFSRLGSEIEECVEAGTNWIHCDIMDGHFVPNISYGPDIVQVARNSAPEAILDVHLMIENPDNYIESFADAGADLIAVHYEACPHLHRTVQNIKSQGCMAGVVINPATPVTLLKPILPDVDLVLLMSVNPGFGGQEFISGTYDKIRELVALKHETRTEFLIQIDGGVGEKNIKKLTTAGAQVLVAGSSVFKAEHRGKQIQRLLELAQSGAKGHLIA